MEKVDTDTLRSVSSKWSLGGDKRLLDLLQNIHEKVVTKCKETNSKLDELVNKLDTASIDLQNVNNKFMALSNTQFIERRVYDDDVDIAPPVEPPKEPPKIIDPNEEIEKLKQSIQIFESMHEVVQIIDSDSSDDEDEERLVLKPKNLYANRPLPYIIGSELWKTKWHAGLVVEDSDTDSQGCKHEQEEEYSDSEPEITDTQTDKHIAKDTEISNSTSIEASTSTSLTKPTKPADIAAELARRLGGDMIPPPPPPMNIMPEPTTKKVYRPEQPTRATIFSNEPPPLDQVESDSSEEDIFAELHRNRFTQKDKTQSVANVVDDLFGNVESVRTSKPKETEALFDDESESELFVEKPRMKQNSENAEEASVKKPVGGISLFGSNKNSNIIGAAILKRQQPKSSDEETDISDSPVKSNTLKSNPLEELTTTNPETSKDNQDIVKNIDNNKSIIEDLFIKPKPKNSSNKTKQPNKHEIEEKQPEKRIDLFSDDLFDDIDDIFTSKITKTTDTKRKETLFDSDDDLFSENIVAKPQVSQAKRSLVFSDSDDDLFKETTTKNTTKNSATYDKVEIDKNITTNTNDKSKLVIEKEINLPQSHDSDLMNKKTKTVLNELNKNQEFMPKSESNITTEHASLITSHTITKPNIFLPNKSDIDVNNEISDSNLTSDSLKPTKKDLNTDKEASEKSSTRNNKFKNMLDAESDDDLFQDNTASSKAKDLSFKTTIFDDESDSELFNNVMPTTKEQSLPSNKNLNINETNESRNINTIDKINSIDAISDATSGLIGTEDLKTTKTKSTDNDDSDEELFTGRNKKLIVKEELVVDMIPNEKNVDENSRQDLHNEERNVEPIDSNLTPSQNDKPNLLTSKTNINVESVNMDFNSPLVFDDDEMEALLTSKSKEPTDILNNADQDSKEVHHNTRENVSESTISTCDSKYYHIESQSQQSEETLQSDGEIQTNELYGELLKGAKIVYEMEGENKHVSEPLEKETSPFSEIFNDVPPEFEKPKEPKKSKNVNALFDDDSDDESLFFKKSSDVSDDLLVPDYTHERFSIFHDEPPAIEVDFTAKSSKASNNNHKITEVHTELNKDLTSESKLESSITSKEQNLKSDIQKDFQSLESSIRSTNAIINDKINQLQTDVRTQIQVETQEKSIGKLKPVNFNINVKTLLPGAAPRKPKLEEELDGSISSKVEDNNVKSIHFKETESSILDNKLSKERAKIQVKRKPSTRRARKEAARKSGIDFGDSIDSTDNSSSIDEPKKDNKTEDTNENVEVTNVKSDDIDSSKATESSKTTTKVVYILNDEDIFSDDNKNLETNFKSQDLNTQTDNKMIATTLSANNKDNNQNSVDKNSIFDLSDSETELFGAKKTNITQKAKLFDSDSDDNDELFGTKKGTIVKDNKQKPLFSDDSDGELFSTSKKSNEKKISSKPSEPVFEDPLSILNQDES